MMGKFPLKEGAKEMLNYLNEKGHKVIIATARATDWHCDPEGVTKKWLKDNGIKYDKLYVGRIDKEKICEEEHADIFLDDDLKITARVGDYFKRNGNCGKSFLFSTAYNKEFIVCENVERVYDFRDFLNKII